MSADGAAMRAASSLDGTTVRRDASSGLAPTDASANQREVEVLRNSLSAVMVEYHEQSKKFASVAADHARQSQEIARLSVENLELSRNLAALADAATRSAAAEAERDELRARCGEFEKRLFDIESSTSWVATRRFREVFTRHPRLRRLATTIVALARAARRRPVRSSGRFRDA